MWRARSATVIGRAPRARRDAATPGSQLLEHAQIGLAEQAEHFERVARIPRIVVAEPGPLILIETQERRAVVLDHLPVAPTARQLVLGRVGQNRADGPFAGRANCSTARPRPC